MPLAEIETGLERLAWQKKKACNPKQTGLRPREKSFILLSLGFPICEMGL